MSSGLIFVFGIFLLVIIAIALIWFFAFRQGSKAPVYRSNLNGQGQFQMRLSPDNQRASYDLLVNANMQQAKLIGSNNTTLATLTLSPVPGFPGWSRSSGVIPVSTDLVSALKAGKLQVQLGNLGIFTVK